ncbi:MAG: isoleucine--tRNA ligase [Pantoea sp. Brub]|nr:isoleucine--tRNA ligase [Pantoea sp. Brub]
MIDYKSTLNLPKTKFPMKGNLVKSELATLKRWHDTKLYTIVRKSKQDKKIFFLHDGPPYANGSIHIGHSVNKILKDIIIKSKGMGGYNAPYIPGWDCHGLPIEHKVEQMVGKPGENISYSDFRKVCRKYVNQQIENQKTDFIRLGILGDWENPYLTMNFKTEANIIRLLGDIIHNGYLYRGVKPVHWCLDCCSALAEAEVEYKDKISASIDVIFDSIDNNDLYRIFNIPNNNNPISIIIWTTTPWTIPLNCAISVHPKFTYQLIQVNNRLIIIAKELVKDVLTRLNLYNWTILGECLGADLEFRKFKHPFLNIISPVILSDNIKLNVGTGAVHIAPNHGLEDYILSKKYNLKIVDAINPNGSYSKGIHPILDNMNIFEANDIIVNLLKNKNALFSNEKHLHSYPHCWRHKTPVIFRATPQWFISMDRKNIRERSIQLIKNVKWIPNWGKTCMESMLLNRPDWCISRQRTWGVPIALFIHKETKQLHPDTIQLIQQVALLVEKYGVQIWWDLDPSSIIKQDANNYIKVIDTLDVWFDSGSTIYTIIHDYPNIKNDNISDLCLEGSDQYRGWFMSSLIISTAVKNQTPYRQILTQGFTVDENGQKMSKSLGNVISPQSIVNKFGSDVLRLWVASTDYSAEMKISEKLLTNAIEYYRRIRNTARFFLANLNDFNPSIDLIQPENMILIDRWAVSRANQTQKNIIDAYENYNFHEVIQHLMQFCSVDMGSIYLDIIKDRQYTARKNSLIRRSAQTALWHIIQAFVRWISPIISFTADEIWGYLIKIENNKIHCIFSEEWYRSLFDLSKSEKINNDDWNTLLKIRCEVNKIIEQARTNKYIGSSLESSINLYVDMSLSRVLKLLGDELKFFLITSNTKIINYNYADKLAKQSNILNLKIYFCKADGRKCPRCWHYTTDIGQNIQHIDVCQRCYLNMFGEGENRNFI